MLLLSVLFLAPATPVCAGDNLVDNQKIQKEMSDLTTGPGSWIWEEKTLDNQTRQLWNRVEIPKAAGVTKARLALTVDNDFTLYRMAVNWE